MIAEHRGEYSVALMCRALEVSRAGFYSYEVRKPSHRALANRILVKEIEAIQEETRGAYGSPRMAVELSDRGRPCGRHRAARLMRAHGLQARRRRKYCQTTHGRHARPCAPNLLERDFTAAAPNRAWVSDVTFVWTTERWLYLAVILDLFSRRVVGWAMGTSNDTSLVLRALRMAIARRDPEPGLILHSDRGSTFASEAFVAELARHGIIASMSRKGDCWDNAVAESFFASLKVEWLRERGYARISEAMGDVFSYIELFYNVRRRHSAIGNISPVAFEMAHWS